jgi:hypothetical protein
MMIRKHVRAEDRFLNDLVAKSMEEAESVNEYNLYHLCQENGKDESGGSN